MTFFEGCNLESMGAGRHAPRRAARFTRGSGGTIAPAGGVSVGDIITFRSGGGGQVSMMFGEKEKNEATGLKFVLKKGNGNQRENL